MTADLERVPTEPLSRAPFAPFGDVIDTEAAYSFLINEGTTRRFHDLAHVDVAMQEGTPLISIFRGEPFIPPLEISMLERHPLGSQAFVPLTPNPYLVVVALAGEDGSPVDLRGFLAAPGQGVNYGRNVWHHPLISLAGTSDFLVVDRGGPGNNLDEHRFERPLLLDVPSLG